ncbi:plasmid partitioning protein RepB C-terminal domain-containing protein [Paraburkholderia unamae]|uniref:Plasmid partitioning protein RepB C-terminal domain-containing protein n=1 Tax=Paraburkholderia unamae TaxID=219649 RepID=A0ACC6RU86_9BURK
MNDRRMPRPVSMGFERRCLKLELASLRPGKTIASNVLKSDKYAQIVASIRAIGLVEPIVVKQHPAEAGAWLIIDGHLRVEALRSGGVEWTECLVALDDESFTYNRHFNGMAAVQEHRMIVRALDSGVPAEDLAAALGKSVETIKARFRLLNGICDEAASILSDKQCALSVFDVLRKMKPFRQIDAATRMVDFGNYSVKFALAMLEATPEDQRVEDTGRAKRSNWSEVNARLEREVAALQEETRLYDQNYGRDTLQLMMITTYLQGLLTDAPIVLWLSENRRDYLTEFKKIAEIRSLPTGPEAGAA